MASTEDLKNSPDFTNAAYCRMSPAWDLWTDVTGGQDPIRAKGEVYLPKEPAEDPQDYKVRLARSLFFEDARDCQINLGGLVFRKSPTLGDDVPDLVRKYSENIDNAGSHLEVFLQRLFEDGFYGHSFVVVERPPADPNIRNLADEQKSGARSYLCLRQAKDALNWQKAVINGKTVLAQITFRECTSVPDGLFGEQEVMRWRVYLLNEDGDAAWQLWEEQETDRDALGRFAAKAKRPVMIDSDVIRTRAGVPLKRLPIAVHYGEQEDFLVSRPPLKGIADIVVGYYQKYSDKSNIQHHTCAVTLVIEGDPNDNSDKTLGGNRVLYVGQGQKAYFLEVNGDSIPSLERDLEMLQKRLVAKGLDFVQEDHRVPTTATESLLAYTTRTSKLGKMVRSTKNCAEELFDIMAEMEGVARTDRESKRGGSISLGVDENALTLSPEELDKYSLMNERGQMSLRTVWAMMARADKLPEDFDADKEQAELDAAAKKQMELNAKQFDAGMESTP